MQRGFQSDGTDVHQTAGEAHHQLGKCERAGDWAEEILELILDDIDPQSEEERIECVARMEEACNK